MLRETVKKHGYAFIKRFKPELNTLEAASELGSVLTLEGFATVQEIRPHPTSHSPPNTYSGNFGDGEFPMHTDLAHWSLPPHYFALRCISGTQEVATSIYDGNLMLEDLDVNSLRRALVQPRRPLRNGKQLLRLVDYLQSHDTMILRWDSTFLRPATANSEKTYLRVREYINSTDAKKIFLLAPGDTLIVDNWRMTHSRSLVPASSYHRHIDRVYLEGLH